MINLSVFYSIVDLENFTDFNNLLNITLLIYFIYLLISFFVIKHFCRAMIFDVITHSLSLIPVSLILKLNWDKNINDSINLLNINFLLSLNKKKTCRSIQLFRFYLKKIKLFTHIANLS